MPKNNDEKSCIVVAFIALFLNKKFWKVKKKI